MEQSGSPAGCISEGNPDACQVVGSSRLDFQFQGAEEMHGCVSFRPGQVLCLRSATTSFWHSDAVRGPSTPTWIPMLSLGVASPPTELYLVQALEPAADAVAPTGAGEDEEESFSLELPAFGGLKKLLNQVDAVTNTSSCRTAQKSCRRGSEYGIGRARNRFESLYPSTKRRSTR